MLSSYRCRVSTILLWLHISLAANSQSSSTSSSAELVETISDCQLEGLEQRCTSGGDEYLVEIPPSQTDEPPSQYTGCHAHDADLFCLGPGGEDVFVRSIDSSLTDHDDHEGHDDHSSHGEDEDHSDHEEGDEAVGAAATENLDCHFHAGVEHCTGGAEETAASCDRVERDYDIPLRIGTLFVVLVTSSIGVYGPIFLSHATRNKFLQYVFLVMKQFGTGVIISTAFVHLYTHSNLMFQNECLGELDYESTTGAIVMAGILISFIIDYAAHRFVDWRRSKTGMGSLTTAARDESSDSGSGLNTEDRNKTEISAERTTRQPVHKYGNTTKLDVIVLESGIIFHSIILGLTSVIADDSYYITLFIVVVFHQFFEGVALGTRIADIPYPSSSSSVPAHLHSQPNNTLSLSRKLLLALPYSLITPIGMAIGIGVLGNFNGNDPGTIIAIGTLDAISAGILIWVGLVELLAKDWLHEGSELAGAGIGKVFLAGVGGLIPGLILMSLLGKWI